MKVLNNLPQSINQAQHGGQMKRQAWYGHHPRNGSPYGTPLRKPASPLACPSGGDFRNQQLRRGFFLPFLFGGRQPNSPSIRKQKTAKNIVFPFTHICPHALSWSSVIKTDSLLGTCCQILSPWRGDIVDYGKRLLYRSPSLCGRMGRYDNPMTKSP